MLLKHKDLLNEEEEKEKIVLEKYDVRKSETLKQGLEDEGNTEAAPRRWGIKLPLPSLHLQNEGGCQHFDFGLQTCFRFLLSRPTR